MKIRKNQKRLTTAEWGGFVSAFQGMREGFLKGVAKPTLDDFADEHAAAFKEKNHYWLVHSHEPWTKEHWGLLFFAWHRQFLDEFEKRLRRDVPGVTIPYWNALLDPLPVEIKKICDNPGALATRPGAPPLPNFAETDFYTFQFDLETGYHNTVHSNLGGTLGGKHSPRDASFWLHHAFVDRQWGHWFEKHNGALPPAPETLLRGGTIVTGKQQSDMLHTTQLDYVYGNGIFNSIETKGSDTFKATLEQGMILCAKLAPEKDKPDDQWFIKMFVAALSPVTASITMQHFPFFTPGAKAGLFPSETMFVDLRTGKLDVSQAESDVRFVKSATRSGPAYSIEAVNGTRLAQFTQVTDFTGDGGKGTVDYEMLYI